MGLRNLPFDRLMEYDFAITDGEEGIELLAGWKRNLFDQVLATQRRGFKTGNPMLRPGSLISAKKDDRMHHILFLHTDSGTADSDYNNRKHQT